MTALGSLTGSVSVSVSSLPGIQVAEFALPIAARVEPDEGEGIRLVANVGPDSLGHAIATALRDLADSIDPDRHAPVDLEPVELAPGFVHVVCDVCGSQVAGRPGERLEHADGGAHVYETTLGG